MNFMRLRALYAGGGKSLMLALVFHCLFAANAQAARPPVEVTVAEPYLELRTGPAGGYPVFHVVDRGEQVQVIERRTDWFLVRTADGKEGWAERARMEETVMASGEKFQLREPGEEDFWRRRWEMGVLGGEFEGAAVMALYGGYAFTPNLSAELSAARTLGDFSSGTVLSLDLLSHPFPQRRISPFFMIGAGMVETRSSATLVRSPDRRDAAAHAGLGLRAYLTKRFFLRLEYRNYVVFTSDADQNEEIDEWKAGFAVFF